jgi:hypothetical protein
MKIEKRRIRSLSRNIPAAVENKTLVLAFAPSGSPDHEARLANAGFVPPFEPGRAVLPAAVKSVSRYNAEGMFVPRRDEPKETAYRRVEWHWTELHGTDRIERCDFKDIPYKRYPRSFAPPPEVELKQALNTAGERLIVSAPVVYKSENEDLILHTINLMLELFGECDVLDEDLASIIDVPVKRLNWHVLPPGKRTWSELERQIKEVVRDINSDKRKVFRHNLDYINQYGPDFAAAGLAGFNGYVVFGFPNRNLFVCESIHNYNATYVFEQDWMSLSRKSKAEILAGRLHKDRVIHQPDWYGRIDALLK